MIGAIIIPKNSPNLIHALFKGVKIFELSNPKTKNGKDNIIFDDMPEPRPDGASDVWKRR